jgi:hypothetical protein
MDFYVTRVVTGTNPDGQDSIVSTAAIAPTTVRALPGAEFYQLWGTSPGAPQVGAVPDDTADGPVLPPPGGTRLQIMRWPPDSAGAPDVDATEPHAEEEQTLPGVLDAIRPGEAGTCVTDTVDWNVVLAGEMVLVMEDGSEAVLGPGTCVVQRGTRHVWHNRTGQDAWLLTVFLGAERKP